MCCAVHIRPTQATTTAFAGAAGYYCHHQLLTLFKLFLLACYDNNYVSHTACCAESSLPCKGVIHHCHASSVACCCLWPLFKKFLFLQLLSWVTLILPMPMKISILFVISSITTGQCHLTTAICIVATMHCIINCCIIAAG